VGFDAIDRKFRRREIKLECVDCQSTDGVRMQDPYTAHPLSANPAASMIRTARYHSAVSASNGVWWS
jgi:hypothetical protein